MSNIHDLKKAEENFKKLKESFSTSPDWIGANIEWAINQIINIKPYTPSERHDLLILLHHWHVNQFKETIKESLILKIRNM